MNIDYERLYEDYLVSKGEKTKKVELDEFQNEKEQMAHWLQNVRGLSPEQAEAVIAHSPMHTQIQRAYENKEK